MKVRFHADYNHRWPSRAITHFLAGYEGTVKREVGELAIQKGKATEVSKADMLSGNAQAAAHADIRGGRGMARPDDAPDVGTSVFDQKLDGTGQ